MSRAIYYLPGRNGKLSEGLGAFLQEHCDELSGREVSGDVRGLPFEAQLEVIRQDLIDSHWHENGRLVANSYGAYLLLHALINMEPYPGKMFLLSPILGAVQTKDSYFRPPSAKLLLNSFDDKTFPMPRDLSCIVGDMDWQSVPDRCELLCNAVGGSLEKIPIMGHGIEPLAVASSMAGWFNSR